MRRPPKLFRFRPLDDSLLEREMDALGDSYLYAPSFAAMNDPMEAFYETGGPGERIIDAIISPSGRNTGEMQAGLASRRSLHKLNSRDY